MAVLGAGVVTPGAADLSPSSPSDPSSSSPESATAVAPKVRTVVPGRLERGPNARVPYLQDGWIHVDGKRFRTGLPRKTRQLLLGDSGGAWLVANGRKVTGSRPARTAPTRVHAVRRGRAPVLVPGSHLRGLGKAIRVSRDGAHLLLGQGIRESTWVTVRRVSDGALVDEMDVTTASDIRPYDAADGRVLWELARGDETGRPDAVDWEVGGEPRSLGAPTNAGFLRRDLVFLADGETGRHGPTSISAPAAPPWSAKFVALDVSPDGRLVLGTGPRLVRQRQVLQVRRMADGALVQQLSFGRRIGPEEGWYAPQDGAETARFESSSRFVFEFAVDGKATFIRCSTAGRCVRASRSGGSVSTTYERTWWR